MATYQIPPGTDLSKTPVLPAPPGHPQGVFIASPERERNFLAVGVTMMVVSSIIVSGRLYLNTADKARKLSWDDAFCVIGWVFSVGWTAIWISVRNYFRRAWDIPLSWYTERYFKIIYASNVFLPAAQFFTKGAFVILLLRIFYPNKPVRFVLYALFAFTFCAYWVSLPIFSYYCAPRSGESWTLGNVPECNKANLMGPILGAFNAFIDLFLFFLPLSVISTLRLSSKRKYQLMAIFMTGILAVAAGIVGLAYRIVSWRYGRGGKDVNYYNYYQLLCAILELFISAICSSMPAYATFGKQHISPRLPHIRNFLPSSLRFSSSRGEKGGRTGVARVETDAPRLETRMLDFGNEEGGRFTGRGYHELGEDKPGTGGCDKVGTPGVKGGSGKRGSRVVEEEMREMHSESVG